MYAIFGLVGGVVTKMFTFVVRPLVGNLQIVLNVCFLLQFPYLYKFNE